MSTTYTLLPAIPSGAFVECLPEGVTVDGASEHTRAWVADGHARANLALRMGADYLHAFCEDGYVVSLERYGRNKAEPMVLAICAAFGVQMEADFGWTYPDDGACETP